MLREFFGFGEFNLGLVYLWELYVLVINKFYNYNLWRIDFFILSYGS